MVPGLTAANNLEFVHYPITHSLLAVLGWGLLFGGLFYLVTRRTRGALVLGALVVSHWILAVPIHAPDPLSNLSPLHGVEA